MSSVRTLLIVDDCAEDREVYREYLLGDHHHTYRILEAATADVGLSLCREEYFDAILLDFCLPDMDGLEFLDELKELRLSPLPPIIMLTGQGDEAIAVQAMKQGVQDYLVKHHLQPVALRRAIRHVVEQADLQNLLSKTRDRQRLIATTALRIRQSLDLEQILHTAVAEVRQLLGCDYVAVYQFMSGEGGRIVAELGGSCQMPLSSQVHREGDRATGWSKDDCQNCAQADAVIGADGLLPVPVSYLPLSSPTAANLPDRPFRGNTALPDATLKSPLGLAIVPVSLPATIREEDLSPVRQQLLDCQVEALPRSDLVVPITLNPNGYETAPLWGVLVAHCCSQGKPWQPDDEMILQELAVQLAIAIQQAELLAKTQVALKKEQDLNAFKSQIIATVSHEYRTPLAVILAAASTLTQHGNLLDATRQNRFLHLIEQKTRHMTRLVDDMLVVYQSELNQTRFKPFPLDLIQFVTELVAEKLQTEDDHCPVIVRTSGNSKNFWGDQGLLRLMLDNLLSNAIKYSPNREPIEVRIAGKPTCITVSIKDKGIGIPPAEQPDVFQSFSRGSNVGTIPGTGLGLAIAKTCVELHKGEISLESKVGRGTKVLISLPKQAALAPSDD